ncbi:MAG TPA: squalene synthase HpnC [Burkholderiaceae bacterium]|nr:squalene synthase HpnC [Burkholderiaceae bacterium]
MPVDHYENFPVASWLCPPALREPIEAIYRFARTADDIADEGAQTALERQRDLDDYTLAFQAALDGRPVARWRDVMLPLARAVHAHALPRHLFLDLLSAFRQDTGNPCYTNREDLLDYCARSANPIGRLLLHLAQQDDDQLLEQSDAVCSALQLINFWQDLSIDLPRGRCYVPRVDARRHGIALAELGSAIDTDATRALVAELINWSRALMLRGAPLVHRLPGRFGWELRLVVHGGLRVLEKIERGGCRALSRRPTVGVADLPRLAWRALWMRRGTPTSTPAERRGTVA